MTSRWCWSLVLISGIACGQTRMEFQVLTKVPLLSGTAIGVAFDAKSIFLRDWQSYYHYSFEVNSWSKLKFQNKLVQLDLWSPKSLSYGATRSSRLNNRQMDISSPGTRISTSIVPTFGKVISLADQLEILDIETFGLSYIKIDGGVPVGGGNAVWHEKIYLFGGLILAPGDSDSKLHKWDIEFSNRLIAFDLATLSFQELAPLPGPRFAQGAFINEKLYVLGTEQGSKASLEILRYDPPLNTWENLGRLPVNISDSLASSGDLIYLLGIRGMTGYLIVYNTVTNQFTEYETNVKWKLGAACVHENKLYYFGGVDINFPRWIARNMYVLDLSSIPK